MKKQLLICLLMLGLKGMSQGAQNVANINGAIVKREQGSFTDPQSKKITGQYAIVYIIDTIQRQLLNVSVTSKDKRGEVIYLYYYTANQLAKASAGVVDRGYTVIQNTYDYDKEDHNLPEKDLQAFSQTDEKYALLKESRKYLAVLKRL